MPSDSLPQPVEIPVQEDSLVCLKKSILLRVIYDLKKGDMNEQKVSVLEEDISTKDQIISTKEIENNKQNYKIRSLESSLMDCNQIEDINQKTIQNLNDKISTQKRKIKAWKIISVALLVGIALK